MKERKGRIKVKGNLYNVAKYLLANEQKIFLIFDYNNDNEKGLENDTKITNKGKTIRTSSKSV